MSNLSIEKIQNGSHGIEYYRLEASPFSVTISTLGASIIDLFVPDRNGNVSNIVLGYENLDDYREGDSYFGATIGRYSDKITNASFTLGEKKYQLDSNNLLGHSVHGGSRGFNSRIWKVKRVQQSPSLSIQLWLESFDGDMGYPGNLEISVTYFLSSSGRLTVLYETIVDTLCPVSLTNHTYFNLSNKNHILDHKIKLYSSKYLNVDNNLNYSGEIVSVENTRMDLRDWTRIGERIKPGNGFDHAFIIDDVSPSLKLCAQVFEPSSGRTLDVYSTYPVVLVYTGNHLNRRVRGRDERSRTRFGGLSLEAEQYPDSMNHSNFSSAVQQPEVLYKHTISYSFGVS